MKCCKSPKRLLFSFFLRGLRGLRGEILFLNTIDDRTLIESALARPQQAADYENADLIRQAATMCFGLVKNHPWKGGNKRTATLLMKIFLWRNGVRYLATIAETIQLVHHIEADRWKVDEIEAWLRAHTSPLA